MKIANKISISFFIITLIIITGVSLIFYKMVETNLRKRIFAHLVTTAQAKAPHIETFLELKGEAIKQLAQSEILKELLLTNKKDKDYRFLFKKVLSRLKNTVKETKYIFDISLINRKGISIVSTMQKEIGQDKSNCLCFLNGKKDIFIKDACICKNKKVPAFTLSSPITDEENNFLGVVLVKVLMEGINRITTSHIGLGKRGEIYLVNKDGYMITPSRFKGDTFLKQRVEAKGVGDALKDVYDLQSEKHRHIFENVDGDNLDQFAKGHKKVTFSYKNYQGKWVLGVHEHIHQLPWGLIVEMDRKEALAPLKKIKYLFIGIMGMVPLIVWVGGSVVGGIIANPIKKLRRGVEKIGKGELNYKVGTKAEDEIGQLSRAFDQMAQDLKESTISIDFLNYEIARRKQIEEKLQLFSHAVESAAEGIVLGNLMGEITYMNESFIKMFGYSREEITGRKITFLYSQDEQPKVQETLNINMQNSWKGEMTVRRKDGTPFPMEIHSSVVRNTSGRIIACMVTYLDITERRQIEEKLQLFSHAVESAIVGMAIANLEGRFIYVNKAFIKMFGYTKEELIGREIAFIYSNDKNERAKLQEAIEKTKTIDGFKGELLCRRKDGLCFPLEVNASAVKDASGQAIALVAGHVDITQHKQAQEKMKEAVRIKSDFLSRVSHELRTPLTAIKEGIGIVLDRSAGEINADQEDFLATAKRNVDRLHRLINDVLDFSKLEARKAEFKMKENDLNSTIKEIVKMQQPVLQEKGLYLKLDLSNNMEKILFDEDKISQVLTNLMSNAIKYTSKGGITINSRKNGEVIRVGIKDTGQGIKTDDLNKLFQQFQQVGKEFRKPGSTGLGLAISKEIIGGHKGKIWAESRDNVGSEFIFTLPIIKERRKKV